MTDRMRRATTNAYRRDLARIHDAGFGMFAEAAADMLLAALGRGMPSLRTPAPVVDLGCGGGILAERIAASGRGVMGLDVSLAMLEIARRRAPDGRFILGSWLDARLPRCAAVAAVGEIVNYLFDERNDWPALKGLIGRAYRALEPGGVFLFDSSGPGRAPAGEPAKFHRQGEGWAILSEAQEDERGRILTRRIASFTRQGRLYRRDDETHRLRLYPADEIAEELRRVGFAVRVMRGYGKQELPEGMRAFWARKPSIKNRK